MIRVTGAFLLILLSACLSQPENPNQRSSTLDTFKDAQAIEQAYYDSVANRVKASIHRLKLPSFSAPGVSQAKIRVLLTLSGEGELRGISLKESTSSPVLDDAILQAIENSQPFPPAPLAIVKDDTVYVGWSAQFRTGIR